MHLASDDGGGDLHNLLLPKLHLLRIGMWNLQFVAQLQLHAL